MKLDELTADRITERIGDELDRAVITPRIAQNINPLIIGRQREIGTYRGG